MTSAPKVIVIGGGPIGALSALYAAKRGCEVEIYELRDDPNYGDPNARPDIAVIPLALSERGIRAIAGAAVPGLIESILDGSRPLHTRLVHTRDTRGNPKNIPMVYGPQGQCLYTIQREKVTKHVMLQLILVLTYAHATSKEPNVKMHFNQRLDSCDFEEKVAVMESVVWKKKLGAGEEFAGDVVGDEPKPVACPSEEHATEKLKPVNTSVKLQVKFDFIIGADGTYSSVRQSMMRQSHMDFSQSYEQALWCDFIFPPVKEKEYPLDAECFHLWPADKSIVVAQPDFDYTFRAGMICETDRVRYFEHHPEEFVDWFANEFPGIVPELVSAEEVTRQFVVHQKIPLKSVKTGKLGYKDCAVLLGDSSHAMTPFHAMGMITGLEDVRIFFEEFRDPRLRDYSQPGETMPVFCAPGTVQAYETHRLPDVHAMVDMAAEHYQELRIGVRSSSARAKKIIEATLSRWAPWLDWTTAYARIQFSHERMTTVRTKEERQTRTIKVLVNIITATFAVAVGVLSYHMLALSS